MSEEEKEVSEALSFIVLNAVYHLNGRAKLHMDIYAATQLRNDIVRLLMNEYAKKAVLKYLNLCMKARS